MDFVIAGAGGGLGRLVAAQLVAGGHAVRAVQRGQPPDARGAAAIIHCAGASVAMGFGHGWRGYGAVDVPIGRAMVDAARAGGTRLIYVGVHHAAAQRRCAYVAAHEQVVDAMRDLPGTIVRATGFFSAYAALLPMARRGRLVDIGDGSRRTNPIDEGELAAIVVRTALDPDAPRELAVGGPEILTRREIFELVAARAGRRVAIANLPTWFAAAGALALRVVHPRIGQFARFAVALARADVIAPCTGTSRFADYLAR